MHKLMKTGIVLLIITIFWFYYLIHRHDLTDFEKQAFLDTPDIIKNYGYPAEEHLVQSPDGYLLALHRIPKGRNSAQGKGPVLLYHAFLQSSADYVLMGPENSFAFVLADAGYDVWLGNQRGNYYSNKHVNLSNESKEFWNFGIYEISVYDVPAVIDYILKSTNYENLTYMGLSLGGLMPLIMLSEKPEYNLKMNMLIPIAPALYISPNPHFVRYIVFHLWYIWKVFLEILNVNNVFYRQSLLADITRTFVAKDVFIQHLFFLFLKSVTGSYEYNFNKTLIPILFSHTPSGTSRKLSTHICQGCVSGEVRHFDYGKLNLEYYGSKSPPKIYKIENIKTKVVLFCGTEDNIIPCEGVERLYSELSYVADKRLFVLEDCTHLDVVYGIYAKQQIYDGIIELLNANLFTNINNM